jgi:putative copper resistance protein D
VDSVLGLQVGAVVALNAAFAWLVGSWLARRWLLASGALRASTEALLRSSDIFAAALGVVGTGAMLWASAAVMGGVSLQEAKDVVWQMLTMTSIGRAGYISFFAITLVLVIRALRSTAVWREWTVLVALGLFAFVRASMGHAGENGYWTLPFAAEVIHLTAMGAWTGLVAVSAWKTMPTDAGQPDLNRLARYLDSMSAAAIVAVVAVFVTGLFNAWNRVGTVDNLFGNSTYTTALLIKVGLVGAALILGGYNKFIGLALARGSVHGLERVKFVLKVESIVLLVVLFAAAVLTSQQPPAAM